MNNSKGYILTFLLIVFLAACSSKEAQFKCEDPIGCVEIRPGMPIKIGVLQTFSGALKSNGVDQLRGIQLALADRDARLLGHPVELQTEDSHCSGEGGTTAALKIVADPQFLGILGTYCSGAAVKAAKIASDAGLVMISATNTSPALTAIGGKPGPNYQVGYFRTAHNDIVLGSAVAEFARHKLGFDRAATINDGDPYTRGLTQAFAASFEKLGGKIVLETAVNKEDKDMKPVLTAVVHSNPELLFYPIFRPAGDFITLQTTEMEGFDTIVRLTADTLFNDDFYNTVKKAGKGMYFALPAMPEGSIYNEFVARYKKEFGEAPVAGQHAHAYDAANLLLNSIEKVAIQKKDGTLYIRRQALRDALYATSGHPGLTGNLTCDNYGDCGVPRFKIVRLDDPAAGFEGLAANIQYTYVPMKGNPPEQIK
jgi:branched-chain amino acid transport system substrate-binding protein